MLRTLYTLLLYLLTPVILARLLWRSRRSPAYARRWRERFGLISGLVPDACDDGKQTEGRVIWVHAVSVGETLAAAPLVRALQKKYPHARMVITTTTPTGSEQVRKLFGSSVHHVYAPYDLPDVLTRFLSRIKPSVLIIMETELWPNLIYKCHQLGVPVVVANARLSEKSAAGYKKISWLARPMLERISLVAGQTAADGRRFTDLGLDKTKLTVTGNIKFDLQLDQQLRDKAALLKSKWQGDGRDKKGRQVWLAASTHRGEDEQVLDAFSKVVQVLPDVLLVLVPRHPERFSEVGKLCVDRGFNLVRRSEGNSITPATQILLGDSMGELLSFCGACDLAFIGGSLVPVGGHNLIEPAAWGVPVLAGPHLFNFGEVATKLGEAGGMKICENAEQLATTVILLLESPNEYQRMADAARTVAESNRGALDKLTNCLAQLLY
ncbi:MAG: 3-deoxy-D-manno-octulosonic acid transferase [Gammaproteobacteria bacterium]|nr:MAG: 3-deoxy-D-manno-octulosonic acid transferase [Gammaproteobacteria bacterium]RLA53289.1 MAG: 3-deoxy-D-manno-octulosonic acid transferase [Gammaproteobacteria bacterium]